MNIVYEAHWPASVLVIIAATLVIFWWLFVKR